MMYKIAIVLISVVFCHSSMAGHIVTDTRVVDTLIQRTDTYANSAGDLRVDERGYGSSSTTSADAAIGSSPSVNFHLGEINDTMLFQSNGDAIVILEGDTCRRMTADSAPPPGLGIPGMNLGEGNKQMNDALAQASSKIEEAMRQARREGMTAEQQRQLEQFTKPFTQAQAIKPRDTLEIYSLGQRTRVGSYSAEGFGVRDLDGNEKHRVWVVPTEDIAGGSEVRNAMQGMLDTYAEYLEQMGGGALMDTGLAAMFEKAELAGKYPVRIEDLDSGEITDVVEAHSSDGGVEYYPDCVAKDIFGY